MNVNPEQNNQNSSNEELVTREEIESGIYVVGTIKEGYRATFGRFALCEPKQTISEVVQMVADRHYDIIRGLIGIGMTGMRDQMLQQEAHNS